MENKKEDIKPRNANGERHGDWIVYWDNGELFYKGSFINNKRHGDWIDYYHNGQLDYKGSYINGKRVGMWKEWNFDTNEYDNIFYG